MIGVVLKMSKDEFIEIMKTLMELFPDKFTSLGNRAMKMWYECLKDLDFNRTKDAVMNYAKANKYPPAISDIREQHQLLLKEEIRNAPKPNRFDVLEKAFRDHLIAKGAIDYENESLDGSMVTPEEVEILHKLGAL